MEPHTTPLLVRPLGLADVDGYLTVNAAVDAGSGIDGTPHSHPYPRGETRDVDAARARELIRWTTALDEPGWRRAWGLFDGRDLVGSLYLAGGGLVTELHRVDMGMGILASHRRRGGGSRLLRAAIDWAVGQPAITWIDLGVFGDNPGAKDLYERNGFVVTGHTLDRFRIDGVSIHDTSMTRYVG